MWAWENSLVNELRFNLISAGGTSFLNGLVLSCNYLKTEHAPSVRNYLKTEHAPDSASWVEGLQSLHPTMIWLKHDDI